MVTEMMIFFAVDKSSENLSALKCFIGYDNGRNFKEYSSVSTYGSDKWNFFPLDTRGDGKLGFLVTSAPNSWKGYQLYMPNAEFSNLLKSATDSHGNVTSISYKKNVGYFHIYKNSARRRECNCFRI